MALIACTDKQKKHRVKASGNLPRKDYYCPHKGCDAVLTLVDCDDEIRTDHFRTKPSSSHSDDCPYNQNDVYLLENGFTNIENQVLEDTLSKLRDDFAFLQKQLNVVMLYSGVSLSDITVKFLEQVGYNTKNKSSVKKVKTIVDKICELLSNYNPNKFNYSGVKSIDFYTMPFPFVKVKLYEDFFTSRVLLLQRSSILLEAILKQHWISKKWVDVYSKLLSHSRDEINNNVDGVQFFSSIDECAERFGRKYNDESIRVNKEYWGIIFKCLGKDKLPYYYSYPQIGEEDRIGDTVFEELHSDDLAVADIHTHGAARGDIWDEVFSTKDFDSLDSSKEKYTKDFLSYLVTPSGVLRKTDGESESLLKYNMPRDPNSIYDVLSVGFIYNRVKRKTTFVPFRAKSINDLLFP